MSILESRLYRALELFTNFLWLNLLWLVACLPIFTIFPATAAIFAVVREWVKKRDPGITRAFFSYFKEDFKQSFWIGIVWTSLGGLLAINFGLIGSMPDVARLPLYIFFSSVGFLYVFASIYLFPTMVNFDATGPTILKNSLLWSVTQPLTTVQCLLVLLASVAVFLIFPATALILGSAVSYAIYWLCDRAFERTASPKDM
jgi:uncharacterized membrane protein YesL